MPVVVGEVGQGHLGLLPQRPQPGPHGVQHGVELVHAPSLPLSATELPIGRRASHRGATRTTTEDDMAAQRTATVRRGGGRRRGRRAERCDRPGAVAADGCSSSTPGRRATPRPTGCTTCSAARGHPAAGAAGARAGPTWRATAARYAAAAPSPQHAPTGLRGDPRRRRPWSTAAGCSSRPGWWTSCPTCPGWPSAGATRCCTAPTATAGRCATSASACSRPARWRVHQALLFSQLSDQVVLLAHEAPPSAEETAAAGRRRGARGPGAGGGPGGSGRRHVRRLSGVRLEDGSFVALDAVVVAPRMVARSGRARRPRPGRGRAPVRDGRALPGGRDGPDRRRRASSWPATSPTWPRRSAPAAPPGPWPARWSTPS